MLFHWILMTLCWDNKFMFSIYFQLLILSGLFAHHLSAKIEFMATIYFALRIL